MKTSPTLAALLTLVACASAPPPAAAPPVDGMTPSASPVDAVASSAAPPAASPPQRPLDLANGCPREVHLYYGEQPGDGKGQAATVAAGATVPVPRGADGTVVVWVTDDKGSGLASVHVTKPMRHVRLDASCSRLDADSTR